MQMNVLENYVLPEGKSLGLKVVLPGGVPESDNAPKEFKGWNLELGGETEAPDWDPAPVCGGGLHVWEWALGNMFASRIVNKPEVVWLAVEYEAAEAVYLGGKVKVPRCKTVAVSLDREEVTGFIQGHTPVRGSVLDGLVVEVEGGEHTVGNKGVVIIRGKGTAKAGDGGYAQTWANGIAEAGDGGTAKVGDEGRAKAGKGGIAIAGDYGVAIAGEGGCAWVGVGGKAKVGNGGYIWFLCKQGWVCCGVSYDSALHNLKPDTFYRLDDSGNLVEVE